jgi:hypothetical protein
MELSYTPYDWQVNKLPIYATKSMEQSPWEGDTHSEDSSQKPITGPYIGQFNPIHDFTLSFSNIHVSVFSSH